MDLGLVKKGLDYTQKRKKLVLLIAALGFSSYGAYRVCNSPSFVKKRNRLMKFLSALASIAEAIGDSAEAIGVISKDVKGFIQSDSDQIPNSLKQVAKITRSDVFSESVVRITSALTVGILRGYRSENKFKINGASGGGDSTAGFPDKALDKLFSPAGSGFVSVVVGSFARNLVMGFYAEGNKKDESDLQFSSHGSVSEWVNVLYEQRCRELVGECIQLFVSTLVTVYLDKTLDINPYEQIFSGLTNPNHEEKARELLASVCNGAVETLVRTSHQVLTNQETNSDRGPPGGDTSELFDAQESVLSELKGSQSLDKDNQGDGWMSTMSTTLAVPSNRRFLLDLTGRVTFETVGSCLQFTFEHVYDGIKRVVDVVYDEVVDRGLEVYRYLTARSSTVATIYFSLCMHILSGPWILVSSSY